MNQQGMDQHWMSQESKKWLTSPQAYKMENQTQSRLLGENPMKDLNSCSHHENT